MSWSVLGGGLKHTLESSVSSTQAIQPKGSNKPWNNCKESSDLEDGLLHMQQPQGSHTETEAGTEHIFTGKGERGFGEFCFPDQMFCLRLPDGMLTTHQGVMKRHAVELYSALYWTDDCSRGTS